LAHETDESRELIRAQFRQMLRDLRVAHWANAVAGDIRASEFVAKVIEKEARLLGLDRMQDEPELSDSDVAEQLLAALSRVGAAAPL
jgi:hypothetical protein